jgi:hypothetical protein
MYMQEELLMQITQAAPPITPTRKKVTFRRDYSELFDALKSNLNQWQAVNAEDISGETPSRKQTTLYLAAKLRRMKIETTHQDGVLYVRTIDTPVEVTNV